MGFISNVLTLTRAIVWDLTVILNIILLMLSVDLEIQLFSINTYLLVKKFL